PGLQTVTLVTGDRVVLRTDATGKVSASLTPGSPHYGRPVEFADTGAQSWLVPKLARSVRAKLDNSVFDVSALASRRRRVPLTVTFARGTIPHSLPGIHVRTATAHKAGHGRTATTASYDARRPLPAALTRSLSGVSRIALRGVRSVSVQSGYDLHTLTIDATNTKGAPLPGADVFILNMDDGRLMGGFGAISDGQWKVSVPDGHYLVIASDFRHLVVDQPVMAGSDTSTMLSMADATVRPSSSYPGKKSLGASLDLIGTDQAQQSGIDYGFSGTGLPKINPVSTVAAGSLVTEVGNQWTKKGYQPYAFHGHGTTARPIRTVALAKEVRSGVPAKLSFTYGPSDFAKVVQSHDSTGRPTGSLDGWFGWSSHDDFAFIELLPTVRPGVIHAAFQGTPAITWDTLTTTSRSFRNFGQLDERHVYRRGQKSRVSFFRAPVTPVADKGSESGGTGPGCSLCIHGGDLRGLLSMLSGAGTTQFGFAGNSAWQLAKGHTLLSRGKGALFPHAQGVTPGEKLTLSAQTGPQSKKWTLSSQVDDAWTFDVPSGDAVVPILRADYVPPTDLDGRGPAGRVSFPITFDNLGPVDARVVSASVKYSTDGSRWHHAELTRKDANTFRVSYPQPLATKAHPAVSLRVSASDAAGRTVAESVKDAYLLPKASSGGRHGSSHQHHNRRFDPRKLCRTGGHQRVSCYVQLDHRTLHARRGTPDPAGWGAPALRSAYDLSSGGADTTVAVVVAYDYPSAEADLNHYRKQFGLPACTSASGCFTKVNQHGDQGHYPPQDFDWGVEASLDLQMISAACPTCHIVLAEANQPSDHALGQATMAAIAQGATVTNHSYGRIETTGIESAASPYDQPGVTAVSSTGDFGYGPASFPASVPDVVAVGGTTLSRSATDPRGWTEKAWQYGGSGCSAYFDKPGYQDDTACHMRAFGDISAVADGLAIYNTSLPKRFQGWLEVGGTSASSPLVAGMIGAAGAGGMKAGGLYGHPGDFNDVVSGSNGFCQGNYICTALPGYDGPTGWGTPKGLAPFAP
ncbi:MAG: S8 family serine peptidase, partial [Nocardioides sp.]